MLVYRVEHREKTNSIEGIPNVNIGPYCSGDARCWSIYEDHNWGPNSQEYPSIRGDVGEEWYSLGKNYVCGFATKDKAYAWFKGHIATLIRADYVLGIYEVPTGDVAFTKSGKQLAFDSSMARCLEREELVEPNESSLLGFGDDGSESPDGEDSLLQLR